MERLEYKYYSSTPSKKDMTESFFLTRLRQYKSLFDQSDICLVVVGKQAVNQFHPVSHT